MIRSILPVAQKKMSKKNENFKSGSCVGKVCKIFQNFPLPGYKTIKKCISVVDNIRYTVLEFGAISSDLHWCLLQKDFKQF